MFKFLFFLLKKYLFLLQLQKDGRKIEFKTKNLKNPQIQLKVDDTVSFYVQKDLRFGGKESAICIVLAKPHPQDARELGLVISVKSDFGFLASIVNSNVFFHFSQVVGDGNVRFFRKIVCKKVTQKLVKTQNF